MRINSTIHPWRVTAYLSLLLLSVALHAEQLLFKKEKLQDTVLFHYQWIDSFSQTQSLEFNLPLKQTSNQVHKRYIPELAQQYIYIELIKAAREIDPREARVNVKRSVQDIKIKVKSRSEQSLIKWKNAMEMSKTKAFNDYLHDNYYAHFTSHLRQKAVKADHLRYISENKSDLVPMAQAVYETLPLNSETRSYVNLLLSWTQSIPYNELEDRVTSNGAGYLPPMAVINQNQGDCDSKSVLMASAIRSLLPDVKMVMVYLPNHALLGISLPFRNNEPTYNFDGVDYLLMEPTGPALMPIGTIALASDSAIVNGLASHENIP